MSLMFACGRLRFLSRVARYRTVLNFYENVGGYVWSDLTLLILVWHVVMVLNTVFFSIPGHLGISPTFFLFLLP